LRRKSDWWTALAQELLAMAASAFVKTALNAAAAFDAIPGDVWTLGVASQLTAAEILPMIAVDKQWRLLMRNDDLWLNKLTVLVMQYAALETIDQASGESAFDWYWRCRRSIGSSQSMAERHYRGEFPFLRLHGKIDGASFTPYGELRFPTEYGVISELIDVLSRSGTSLDAAMDATLLFQGAPPGVAVDGSFRRIHKQVYDTRRSVRGSDLRELPVVLCKQYAPKAPAVREPSPAAAKAHDTPRTTATAAGSEALRRRLFRMSTELTRANERIAVLEAENANLRAENAGLRSENAELRRENRTLRTENARLEGEHASTEAVHSAELDKLRGERDDTAARIERSQTELRAQQRARAALVRQLDALIGERDHVRQLLTAAERAFERADAALQRERGGLAEARNKAHQAAIRAAEAERDAAAQVAVAQLSATAAIEDSLRGRILERGLMTADEFVSLAAVESAVGMVSTPYLKVAAHVMAAQTSTEPTATLPTTGVAGRGLTYMRVAAAVKPSDALSARQLHRRTKQLRRQLEQSSAGAPVAQLSHFIKSQRDLVREALEGTWLSPPTPLTLDDLFEVRKEMSGAMYDALTSFLRKKKVPIDGTREQVRAAMKEAAFEYETGHFTSVDTKEVEVHGRKVSKEVKSHGYFLRVKDPLAVLQQSATVHAVEGRMAWPPNVPADVYPVTIMLDAGGGITKLVLKQPCVDGADSVRRITLLAMLSGVKDTYAAMKEAFGPVLRVVSEWNRVHTYVTLPWKPQLPSHGKWELHADGWKQMDVQPVSAGADADEAAGEAGRARARAAWDQAAV
jgi:hypothetical protein